MSYDVAILAGLLSLAALLLAPSLPRRRPAVAPSTDRPLPLGPAVGPYERWEAERKGQEMLRQLLTPREYRALRERGYLEVPSSVVAGRVYRIPRHRGLVSQIEQERVTTQLCIVPDRWLPDADIVLMHKLMIEADEEHYLQVANSVPPSPATDGASQRVDTSDMDKTGAVSA